MPESRHAAERRRLAWDRVGLRTKLLVPFVVVPLVAIALSGCLTWWMSDWAAERSFDRVLGDKLELAAELLRQVARERVDETARLAADRQGALGGGLDLVATKRGDGPLILSAGAKDPAEAPLASQLEPLVTPPLPELPAALVVTDSALVLAAAAPLPGGHGVLVTGRALTRDLLDRFTALSGTEMGVFAGWQRARVSSFGIDLAQCEHCHDASWRVARIGGMFHTARSFKARPFFTTSLGDGHRYAFMPFALGDRNQAMLAVRQPISALATARRQTLLLLGGGGFVAFVVSLGAWWRLSRHVSRSVSALQRWMESILEGRPAPPPRIVVRGGVDRLAESLATTMAGLRSSRDHLDRVNAELLQMVDTQLSTISSMRDRLGAFLELAKAPERVPDADEVARQMLRHVCQIFGFQAGRMVVLEAADERRPRCLALEAGGTVVPADFDPDRDPVLVGAARRSSVPFHLDPALAPTRMGGSALVVPITARGQTLGVLVLGDRRGADAGRDPDLETLEALVQQGAMALEHSALYQRAQETYLHTTGVLVTTIESKDPYLRGHSDRVARLTVAIAERLGIRDGELRGLELLARFHDVGKICIDSAILLKPGRLSADEYEAIKRHVEIGEAIVAQITSLREHASVVGQHHERWDGTGYVRGLAGGDIRLEARIIAVSDVFDAMTSARPYRAPLGVADVAGEIARGAGTQFDPAVASVFADLVAAGSLDEAVAAAGPRA